MLAIITDATCGEACWTAKEELCCGGNNHGCLNTPGGVTPKRTCKIDGFRYELIAIGKYSEIYSQGKEICNADPIRELGSYRYHYDITECGSVARVKAVSMIQIQNWKELEAYKELHENNRYEFYRSKPYLLWKRVL